MHFIGAGSRNVVFRLSEYEVLEFWPCILNCKEREQGCMTFKACSTQENNLQEQEQQEEKKTLSSSNYEHANICMRQWIQQGVVLRVNCCTYKECNECLNALQHFAGRRVCVSITWELRRKCCILVPSYLVQVIETATDAVLMTDFAHLSTTFPISSSQTDYVTQMRRIDCHSADSESSQQRQLPTLDYHSNYELNANLFVMEIKPKSAWVPPLVEGIVVNNITYLLHPLKKVQCRYSLMSRYKSRSTQSQLSNNTAYCPNMLFNNTMLTLEGLQRLLLSPQNNFVIHKTPQWDNVNTTNEHVHGSKHEYLESIAEALDHSNVWNTLASLQVYGMANYTGDVVYISNTMQTRESTRVFLPALDIELLYQWSLALDSSHVEWLIRLPSHEHEMQHETYHQKLSWVSCQCTYNDSVCKELPNDPYDIALQRIEPFLSFDEAVRRFYVATTAKDVSIITATQPCSQRGEWQISAKSHSTNICHRRQREMFAFDNKQQNICDGVFVVESDYITRIGVIDLDDKHYKSLHYYWQRDQAIMQANN